VTPPPRHLGPGKRLVVGTVALVTFLFVQFVLRVTLVRTYGPQCGAICLDQLSGCAVSCPLSILLTVVIAGLAFAAATVAGFLAARLLRGGRR
jgi:succinate dehydrogenase/fumarate reductase cytochrome b subunit